MGCAHDSVPPPYLGSARPFFLPQKLPFIVGNRSGRKEGAPGEFVPGRSEASEPGDSEGHGKRTPRGCWKPRTSCSDARRGPEPPAQGLCFRSEEEPKSLAYGSQPSIC